MEAIRYHKKSRLFSFRYKNEPRKFSFSIEIKKHLILK